MANIEAKEKRPSKFELRPLLTQEDYAACVRLQRDTWGEEFKEVASPVILMISQKVGGIAAGAFNAEGELCGFIFGLSGVREKQLVHWSHMMAVRHDVAGLGLGTQLKVYQRTQLLERDIHLANWTFDPLVARNAHLNYNHLGAKAVDYTPNLYGTGTGSILHSGLGTDRFLVEWDLTNPRVEETLSGSPPPPHPANLTAPIVNTRATKDTVEPVEETLPDEPEIRIEIPPDIEELKAGDLPLAMSWRENTRRAFLSYLERGYSVAEFHRDPAKRRCWYLLLSHSGGEK